MINRIRTIRKRWLVLFAAVALLAVGLVSGAALAANARADYIAGELRYGNGHAYGDSRHGRGNSAALMSRVAEILGIEQATLESAFATAIDEQAETKFNDRVAQLVADETLTQEQADAATSWFNSRPTNSGPIAIRLAATSDSDKVDGWLARLVEHEKLSQDEADALAAWHDDRPDSLPEVKHGRSKHGKGHYHDKDGNKGVSPEEGSAG